MHVLSDMLGFVDMADPSFFFFHKCSVPLQSDVLGLINSCIQIMFLSAGGGNTSDSEIHLIS